MLSISTRPVSFAVRRVDRSRRLSATASASGKESSGFPGFFSKRVEEGKKALRSAAAEFETAHRKNIEKLDSMAKDDVEFAKWVLGGSEADAEEVHKKNVVYLDELSKRDVEFAKKMLDLAGRSESKAEAFEVIDVEFDEN